MRDDLDPDILDRYLAGRSRPGEAEAVARWLEVDDRRAALLDELRTRLRDAPAFDTEAMLVRVTTRIDRAERRAATLTPLRGLAGIGARQWPRRLAAAAAVLLAVGGSVLTWRAYQARGATSAQSAPIIVASARGERRVVRLGDGSEVTLAPASRLIVSPTYGHEQRTVSLEGEAMFTVRHDADRPFRVRTAKAVIEDLGTEFGVRAYPTEADQQVVVASGSVLFRTERESAPGTSSGRRPETAVLEKNQFARLMSDGTVHVRRDVDAQALLGWVRDELVFDDLPLEGVAAELGRWYDAEIRVGDSGARAQRLTATFRRSSLEQSLAVVAQSLGLRVERVPGAARSGRTAYVFVLVSPP